MNVQTKTWARPLALFIALTMVMMYSFGGVALAGNDNSNGNGNGNGNGNTPGTGQTTYTVVYNKNGGDEATQYSVGQTVTVAPAVEGSPGWVLNGNDTDLIGHGFDFNKVYLPGETFPMPDNNINFKAAKGDTSTTTYTVTYLPGNHGTFAATSTSGLLSGADTPTSPAVTGQTGYAFTGWHPTWSATVTGDATYTAQWVKDNPATTYTVTYLPGNHGTFAATSTSGLLSGADTPTSPAVTGQTGYTFTGWSPSWVATVTGDATYTAQWSPNQTTPGNTGGGGGGGTRTTITPTPPPLAEIPETEAPLVEAPEVVLEEQPIPLADVPQTGDNTNIWLLLALMMGSGAGIVLLGRRKETVEK